MEDDNKNLFKTHGRLHYEWVRAGERLTIARNGRKSVYRKFDCDPNVKGDAEEPVLKAIEAEMNARNDVRLADKALKDFEVDHGTFVEEYMKSEREWEQALFDGYPV